MSEPIPCPLGDHHVAVFEEMPEGYATKRWKGARKEEPYLRCPVCTATFPKVGIGEYLARIAS
jgi:hypothetical protein